MLFGVAFVVCALLIAAHGLRAIGLIAVVILVVTIAQSAVWRRTERFLVRLTGSRQRGFAVILGIFIAILAAFNVYTLLHG
jgi:hypothetical protein